MHSLTGMSWNELQAASPAAVNLVNWKFRSDGTALFTMAALVMAVCLTGFRRGQRWAWYAAVGDTFLDCVHRCFDPDGRDTLGLWYARTRALRVRPVCASDDNGSRCRTAGFSANETLNV